ncbi:MAG: tRNA pseudouridine(55) synthase TruB [Deltaproteobacteria bacterium]|nr:MAG: tRNA pseudouridine(55) synthase TruB [Deltaproteobacteria bacterium]
MQPELNGILLVDKPAGITSAKVVARIKKIFGARKVGHAGTLDPFATGILLCCINRATKLARFLLHNNKKYEAVLHLGIETDTQDSTGIVISTCDDVLFSEIKIRSVFNQFEGSIEQIPPVYSALKWKGTPLYKLARSGKPFQKAARRITIFNIEILGIHLPLIHFSISCSAGTYIRTLCSDIGKFLGCGGHLKELRRIQSGGFSITEAVKLSELENFALSEKISDRIISMSNALQDMPEHIADKGLAEKIMHGNIITKKELRPVHIDSPEGFIKIVTINNDLIAVLKDTKDSNRYGYCCVLNN